MTTVAIAHSRRSSPDTLTALVGAEDGDVVAVPVRRSLIDELAAAAPGVVVIDATTGDFDVLRLCRDVRGSLAARIVVVPPAGTEEAWIVAAIEAGADDVIVAGTSAAMARTRLMALSRSGPPERPTQGRLVVGDVVVDLDGHTVLVGGTVVRFPVRLFRMLVELARRPDTVVTCEQLLQDVWGIDARPDYRRRVRVAASSLRRLLGDGAHRPRLETVVRVGYRLATVAVPAAGR